jgi:hypothetical protein
MVPGGLSALCPAAPRAAACPDKLEIERGAVHDGWPVWSARLCVRADAEAVFKFLLDDAKACEWRADCQSFCRVGAASPASGNRFAKCAIRSVLTVKKFPVRVASLTDRKVSQTTNPDVYRVEYRAVADPPAEMEGADVVQHSETVFMVTPQNDRVLIEYCQWSIPPSRIAAMPIVSTMAEKATKENIRSTMSALKRRVESDAAVSPQPCEAVLPLCSP